MRINNLIFLKWSFFKINWKRITPFKLIFSALFFGLFYGWFSTSIFWTVESIVVKSNSLKPYSKVYCSPNIEVHHGIDMHALRCNNLDPLARPVELKLYDQQPRATDRIPLALVTHRFKDKVQDYFKCFQSQSSPLLKFIHQSFMSKSRNIANEVLLNYRCFPVFRSHQSK